MGKKQTMQVNIMSGFFWKMFGLVVLLIGITVLLVEIGNNPGTATDNQVSTTSSTSSISADHPTGQSPAPWFYDAASDRHWVPGHEHWHSGPPPPLDQRQSGALDLGFGLGTTNADHPTGQTPEPWFFDAANNQHWHAPHGHWHPGPPPPSDQR